MYQQAPGGTPPPPGPSGPDDYRSPPESQGRRLSRSTTNRHLGGVAGGLGEYLGIDANAIRVGFVLVSFVFLAGMGGLLLYVLAWMVIPEAGAPSSMAQDALSGRQWHDWDKSARSWALVLGAVILAIIWSFGVGPGLHWRALPGMLLVAGVVIWLISRRGRMAPWRCPPGNAPGAPPFSPGGQGGPGGPSTFGAAFGQPGAPTAPPGTSGPGGSGPGAPTVPVQGQTTSGETTTAPVAPAGADAQAAADWAQAQRTAAWWANEQLAAAGVPPVQSPIPAQGAAVQRRRGHFSRFMVVVIALLLVVLSAGLSFVLVSGSSLRGGVGDSSFSPANLLSVASNYRQGVGELDVDLSAVNFPPGGKTVTMSVGVGRLLVVVPEKATVTLDATTGLGTVEVAGAAGPDFHGTVNGGPAHDSARAASHLTVKAHVGIGEVEVQRG